MGTAVGSKSLGGGGGGDVLSGRGGGSASTPIDEGINEAVTTEEGAAFDIGVSISKMKRESEKKNAELR